MSSLGQIIGAIESFNRSVEAQVRKARSDPERGEELRRHWQKIREAVPVAETPTGLKLPRLALPQTDEPGEIARYLYGEGLPGEFPFVNGAYREIYLDRSEMEEATRLLGKTTRLLERPTRLLEEPTRLFAGLGLAEDTNQRFH